MFEIGTSLREARLRQSLEFPEVEQATKIRGKYLRALEDEQFDVLPAQTYVKGFLRSYAEYLGLDGQLYVDEYNSRYVVGEDVPPPDTRGSSGGAGGGPRVQSRIVLTTLAGIALVTALVIVAWKQGDSPQNYPGLSTRESSAIQTQPVVQKRPAPAVRLVVSAARGSTSLLVHRGSATGRLLFEGTLELGQSQVFVGGRLWVSVSSPEVLSARLNGHKVRFPTGAPRNVVVTRRGIRLAPGA